MVDFLINFLMQLVSVFAAILLTALLFTFLYRKIPRFPGPSLGLIGQTKRKERRTEGQHTDDGSPIIEDVRFYCSTLSLTYLATMGPPLIKIHLFDHKPIDMQSVRGIDGLLSAILPNDQITGEPLQAEAILLTLAVYFIVLTLVLWLSPFYNTILNKGLGLRFRMWRSVELQVFLLMSCVLIGLLIPVFYNADFWQSFGISLLVGIVLNGISIPQAIDYESR